MTSTLPQFFLFIKQFTTNFEEKNENFKIFFLSSFTCLFFGLLVGSLVGTFLDTPRSLGWWDGITIIFLVFLMEVLTFFYYNFYINVKNRFSVFIRQLNLFKIGFLLAIFIDAFKVGS